MAIAAKRSTVGAREPKARLGRAVRSLERQLAELAAVGLLTPASGERLAAFEPIQLRGPALSATISDERADRV